MKNSTYKWIIGCLIGVIIILVTFLVVKENNIIFVSFSDCLSVAGTLSSIILSVIAMFYTFISGRDTMVISNQIQSTIKEVNKQVQQVSNETKENTEVLLKVKEGVQYVENAMNTSSEALRTIRQENFSEREKQATIDNIEKTQNSMLMFLKKMQDND